MEKKKAGRACDQVRQCHANHTSQIGQTDLKL